MTYPKKEQKFIVSYLDYKIASKALALRLKKVLPAIINNTQTGYVEG